MIGSQKMLSSLWTEICMKELKRLTDAELVSLDPDANLACTGWNHGFSDSNSPEQHWE
jgi:hypothetical protein